MKHYDNGASCEEEQRFEKRMGEEVEHRSFIGRQTDCHHHVTKLRQRGVSEDALDVVLLSGD